MKKTGVVLSLVMLAVFTIFAAMGYLYITEKSREESDLPLQAEADIPVDQTEAVITAQTEMVYQYFYTEDQTTKEQKEPAQSYLEGLTLQDIANIFSGWQILYFSNDRVILRCSIEGKSTEHYILGEEDGFLAVFYEDNEKKIRLKERTDIPISALPQGDVLQLQEGFRVQGEENLARILADYSS